MAVFRGHVRRDRRAGWMQQRCANAYVCAQVTAFPLAGRPRVGGTAVHFVLILLRE